MLNSITFILVLFGQVSAEVPVPPAIDEALPENAAAEAETANPGELAPIVPEADLPAVQDLPETPALDDLSAPSVPDAPAPEAVDTSNKGESASQSQTEQSVQDNTASAVPETPKSVLRKKTHMIPPPLVPPKAKDPALDENDPLLVNPSALDNSSLYGMSNDKNDRALQSPTSSLYGSMDDDNLYDSQLAPNQGKGHIMPIDQAEVPAQEQGVLTKFFIQEGYEDKNDDPLAQIDDEQAKMAVQVQQAKLSAAEREASNDVNIRYAKAARNVADAELKSAKETIARVPGAVPATEIRKLELSVVQATLQIEQSSNQFEISKYQVDVSKAELDAAKLGVTRRVVKSPISGIIVEKYRNEGEWVKPGDPIVKVVYFEKLRVKTTFDINRIPMQRVMKHNAKISVVQKPGLTFNGKVVFANPVIQSGGAYEVWIDVDNVVDKDGFWTLQPGMEAIVTIE